MSIPGGDNGSEIQGSFRFFGDRNPEKGFGKLTPKQEESVDRDKGQINKAEKGVGVSKADVAGIKARSEISQNIVNKFGVETLKNTTTNARDASLNDSHEVTSTIDKILSKAEKLNVKKLEKERQVLSEDYEKLGLDANTSISSMDKATVALQTSSNKLDSFKGKRETGKINFLFGVSKGERIREAKAKALDAVNIDSGFKAEAENLSTKEDKLNARAENLGDAQIELKKNLDTRIKTVKDVHSEILTAKDMHQKLTDIRDTKFKILDSNKRVVTSSAKDNIKNELVILEKKIETLEKLQKEIGKVEIGKDESTFIEGKNKELEGLKNEVKESVKTTKDLIDKIDIKEDSEIPENSSIREMSYVEKLGRRARVILSESINVPYERAEMRKKSYSIDLYLPPSAAAGQTKKLEGLREPTATSESAQAKTIDHEFSNLKNVSNELEFNLRCTLYPETIAPSSLRNTIESYQIRVNGEPIKPDSETYKVYFELQESLTKVSDLLETKSRDEDVSGKISGLLNVSQSDELTDFGNKIRLWKEHLTNNKIDSTLATALPAIYMVKFSESIADIAKLTLETSEDFKKLEASSERLAEINMALNSNSPVKPHESLPPSDLPPSLPLDDLPPSDLPPSLPPDDYSTS